MIVFLDTDVLIDVALGCQPHAESAVALLEAMEQRYAQGFVAWHTLSSFFYLVAPVHGKQGTRQFLADLVRFVDVAPTSTDSLKYAASLPMGDFEDAMQVAAAAACNADVIATRNVRDYRNSPIRATPPESLLSDGW